MENLVKYFKNMLKHFLGGEPITYWLSGDDAFYDWDDDIDELFNLANVLILNNPLAEPNEVFIKSLGKE